MAWPLHMLLVQDWHEHLRNVGVSQIGCSTVGRVYLFMCLRMEFSANDRVRHSQLLRIIFKSRSLTTRALRQAMFVNRAPLLAFMPTTANDGVWHLHFLLLR